MKIFLFIGTTAELIKLAPVIQELNKRKKEFTIITTGQNDIHFEEFKSMIGSPRIISAVTPKSQESSVFKFILWTVRTFFSLLIGMRSEFKGLNKNNSYFIVHGDTVSSLMGALVGTLYGLKLVHIESGLRSFNFFEPFPEEICRYIISRLADIHFCPNEWSVNNLKNVSGEKINTYQNTLIDIFWKAMKTKPVDQTVRQLMNRKKKYCVLVIHRQEHVIFNKEYTKNLIQFIFKNLPKNIFCAFLVHDLSSDFVRTLQLNTFENPITPLQRLRYSDFMHLIEKSEFMITDGGSNQEEMYYMGKPCLLMRNYSERIEGIGKNILLSKGDKNTIHDFFITYKKHITSPVKSYKHPSKIICDYLFNIL